MCSLNTFSALCIFLTVFTRPVVSYEYFGSKTSYFVNANTDDSPIQVDGCRPALFWNLARHGTRNPGDDDILEMGETLPAIRDQIVSTWAEGEGAMEEGVIVSLIEWTFDLTVEDDSLLTESGKREHKEMGQRWGRRLAGLILDKTRMEVRSSSKSRCVESAKAFLEGIFESETPEIAENNRLLRFYDYCQKFINEVDESSETFVEMNMFAMSEYFQEVVTRVNAKTGVLLDLPQISLMWDICRYETAWFPSEDSPWCSVFSEEDLKLFEFQADLKYYYNDGAAYNVTAKMTQPLFADIFTKIEEVKSSQEANVSILNFAHSETLQPFMTALGLYRDQTDLLASDWGTSRQQHKWQVSRIASFATNVGLVVFECETEMKGQRQKNKQKQSKKKSKQTKNKQKQNKKRSKTKDSSEEDFSSSEEDSSSSEEDSSSSEEDSSSSEEDSSSSEEDSLSSEEDSSSSEEDSSSSEEESPRGSEWKVVLFHQEKAVIQPACGAKICSLEDFLGTYRHLAEEKFDTVCKE